MDFSRLLKKDENDFISLATTYENYKWYKPILVIIIGLIIFIILSAVVAILFKTSFSGVNLIGTSPEGHTIAGILNLLTVALITPSLYLATRFIYKAPFASQISLKGKWNWGVVLKSAAIALVVFGANAIYSALTSPTPIVNQFTIITFVLCLIITPFQCFAEEYFFRGFLLQTFKSWFKIPIVAIILQAIGFGAIHSYNLLGLASVAFVGLCFGFLAWYTESLEVSTAIHSINNLLTFLVMGLGITSVTNDITLISVLQTVLVTVVTIILILFAEKRYGWIGFEGKDG